MLLWRRKGSKTLVMMEKKKYNLVIAYLDRVIVNTLSGELWPTNFFDMKVNFSALRGIRDYEPERLVIFANRTIIHTGKKINNPEFWSKMNFLKAGISNYFRISKKNISVSTSYSIAIDWKLGLTGESDFFDSIPGFDPSDTLFIGPVDETGKEYIEEKGITYITIKKFLENGEDEASVSEKRLSSGTANRGNTGYPRRQNTGD